MKGNRGMSESDPSRPAIHKFFGKFRFWGTKSSPHIRNNHHNSLALAPHPEELQDGDHQHLERVPSRRSTLALYSLKHASVPNLDDRTRIKGSSNMNTTTTTTAHKTRTRMSVFYGDPANKKHSQSTTLVGNLTQEEELSAMKQNQSMAMRSRSIQLDRPSLTLSSEEIFRRIAGVDNQIDVEEWLDVCRSLHINLSDEELKRVFDTIDEDKSGQIELEEFVKGINRFRFLQSVVTSFSDHAVSSSFAINPAFDFSKSSAANYAYHSGPGSFTGKFADIRAKLDYSYHSNVTPLRQAWQDKVLNAIVIRNDPQPHPWVVYTCGPMGAGKGYALSWMSSHKYFPLENIVHIDPDHFKMVMPEWMPYVNSNPVLAGALCHQESGLMTEIAQEYAMKHRQHIWVDGSLRDGKWHERVFDGIRKNFPDYQIAIFYVYASEDIVRMRIQKRASETGRDVPEALIRESLEAPDKTLALLTPKVDFVARINNDHSVPKLVAFEVIDRDGNFGVIRDKFARSHPPPNHFPESLAPVYLVKTSFHARNFQFISTPADQSLAQWEPIGMEKINFECEKLQQITQFSDFRGKMSPLSTVLVGRKVRDSMQIPQEAAVSRWCYGIISVSKFPPEDMGTKVNLLDPHVAFLYHGGEVFFDKKGNVLCVMALTGFLLERAQQQQQQQDAAAVVASPFPPPSSSPTSKRKSSSDTTPIATQDEEKRYRSLQFGPPEPIGPRVIERLHLQERFRMESLPRLRRSVKSPLYMCWVVPGEQLKEQMVCPYGGFAFVFHNPSDPPEDAASRVGCLFPITAI
eukprot:c9389_g1_i1.p1 GENE.c9389_g1_i1~~c9389_g1_i1.p1  ORF type:complete len:802 (-),score=185.80 c9389_g1_i1:32-2437(-)